MTILHAFILGFVQGATEFLPISSSGFLVFIPEILGWQLQSILFDGMIHLATLLAIVIALRQEIKQLFTNDRKVIWWIVFATIPVLFFGFLLQEVAGISFRSLSIVAWSFVIWGLVLYVVDRFAKTSIHQTHLIGWKRSLWIGCTQVLALIPGTSRSGITITAGLAAGLNRQTATTFSFLLSIPTILAAGALTMIDYIKTPETVLVTPLLVGGITAFITALVSVMLLRAWLGRGTYGPIALVRVGLGVILLLFTFFR